MIKVSINKKEDIIIINGHSGYDVAGYDIVCAGVSSISITTINAILKIDDSAISYTKDSGYLKIEILKHTEIVDKLIENMISLLKEMEEQYKKYIKLEEVSL